MPVIQHIFDLPAGWNKVYVIVGVNWVYNDEYNYQSGDFLTGQCFSDKSAADEQCRADIEEFKDQNDPDEFEGGYSMPEGWGDTFAEGEVVILGWHGAKKWAWLYGEIPETEGRGNTDSWASVPYPFEVVEMKVTTSMLSTLAAAKQRA